CSTACRDGKPRRAGLRLKLDPRFRGDDQSVSDRCDASRLALGQMGHISMSPIPPMPPMPPPPPPPVGFSSFGDSALIASVVSIKLATDDAFCNAKRATLVGSTTPISTRSPYWPVWAL